MKLAIVAATGGIGRLLLAQAIEAGHDVTAVVRRPEALADVPVRVVSADLSAADPAALAEAFAGADGVLSCLGGTSPRTDTGVAARGTTTVVDAMRASGVRRIIVVSAAPIGTVASPGRPHPPRHDPGEGPVSRLVLTPLIRVVLRGHYADLARMEDVLQGSGLDWTAVRPPRLTDGPLTGTYRTAFGQNLRGGLAVSRQDVAHYMLHALDDPASIGQSVGIAN